MQATENKATKNSRMKGFWKSFFKAFFITSLIVLSTKIYETITSTQDKLWAEYKSPFDTKSEYFKLSWVSRARVYLSEKGISRDHIIQRLLSNYSSSIFLQVKAKIPDGDIALYDYIYMHKLAPIMYMQPIIITPHEKEELLNVMVKLLSNDSKMDNFNKIERYVLAQNILAWFTNVAPESVSIGNGTAFRSISHKINEMINIKDFEKSSSAYYLPFSVALISLGMDLGWLEFAGCKHETIMDLQVDLHRIKNLMIKYQKSKIADHGKEVFLINFNHALATKNKAEERLKQLCNVDIGD